MADATVARNRPIEVGLFLASGDIPWAGTIPSWPQLRAVATRAEEPGFDSLWLADHLLGDFGWEDEPRLGVRESWSLLSALAAVTDTVELGVLVTCIAYRNPAMLASTAATVQEISDGRLFLGLGARWHEPEFRSFGFPFDHRVSRFAEAVDIVTRLLCGERVTFEGAYYRVEDCELRPRGMQHASPPVIIGSKGPRMMDLTARYADAWNSDFLRDPSDYTQVREKLRLVDTACHAAGRDPASLRRSVSIYVDMPGHSTPADHPMAKGRASASPATGTAAELADLLLAYAAEGISRVQVWLDPNTPEGIEAFAEVLDILDDRS